MRTNRVAVAAALRLGGRLALSAARIGDVDELEAIRATIGTVDGHRVAVVAAAHQRWAVLEWCVRHELLHEDRARYLAAQIRLVWDVDVPWKQEILVWDELTKRQTTSAAARAEMGAPECSALGLFTDPSVMRLYANHVKETVGSIEEMWWPSGEWAARPHRVPMVCHVMSDVCPLGRYKVSLKSAHREWPREVPLGLLAFDQVDIRFESIDSSELPERVGIRYHAWWLPNLPCISVPFVCGGGLAMDGVGINPALEAWRQALWA